MLFYVHSWLLLDGGGERKVTDGHGCTESIVVITVLITGQAMIDINDQVVIWL